MPKAVSRPHLPSSSSDFALSSSPSNVASSSTLTLDDPISLLQRFRRPSLLQKAGYLSESRLHSPLASSFTLHTRRRSQTTFTAEESESDKERMLTDSPSSSENTTPPMKVPDNSEEDLTQKGCGSRLPSTPPRRKSPGTLDSLEGISMPTSLSRRPHQHLRPARILNLLAESRPDEAEVKSEAAFQRLLVSCSDLPVQPRTPRAITDRGRYPEEAVHEEVQREETPSDDEDGVDDGPFAFTSAVTGGSEPIAIQKPRMTGGMASGSNVDDLNMSTSGTSSIGTAMDVDMPLGSPSMSVMPSSASQWRYTPPPTTSAVRSNKRKLDDRFDPYPSSSKRRAVSPSLVYLRESLGSVGSPISRNPRLPISIPVNIPGSNVSSATSSPTISGSYPPTFPRSLSMTSSPTLRATVVLSSPIIRPIPRSGRRELGEEKEIEGAGEAVGGLSLS